MKKLTVFILALIFCLSLSVTVLAEDAVKDTAVGYTFDIDYVNTKIAGEDGTIVTNQEQFDLQTTVWAIWFKAEKVSAHVYKATTDGAAMGGAKPDTKIKDNEIMFIIHSSTSDPAFADQYPNWEDKVAALAVKTGNYFILDDTIDIANGTGSGKAKCVKSSEGKAKAEEENNGTAESTPAESEEPVSEEESEVISEEPASEEPASEEVSEIASEVVSEAVSEEPVNSEATTSEMENGEGFPTWAIVAIAVAGLAIIAAIIIAINKKKK